jgi:hypothetical protein
MDSLIAIWNSIESGELKTDRSYRECPMCFNCGFVSTKETDRTGRQYSVAVKCYSCDYWERRKERFERDRDAA